MLEIKDLLKLMESQQQEHTTSVNSVLIKSEKRWALNE